MAEPGRPPSPHAVSPLKAGFLCRCPACGEGRLFSGYLTIAPKCTVCGEDLAKLEQGDGPAVFVILILGFVIVGAALVVEVTYQPPMWVHAVLWPPLIIGGALALLRPLKALMAAMHYRHRQGEVER